MVGRLSKKEMIIHHSLHTHHHQPLSEMFFMLRFPFSGQMIYIFIIMGRVSAQPWIYSRDLAAYPVYYSR